MDMQPTRGNVAGTCKGMHKHIEDLMKIVSGYPRHRIPVVHSPCCERAVSRGERRIWKGTGMAKVQWHRMESSEDGYIRGYISADGKWAIGRSGRQATVWVQVDDADMEYGSGLPYCRKDALALCDRINGVWYMHRWDSVNIGDAKFEVAIEVNNNRKGN